MGWIAFSVLWVLGLFIGDMLTSGDHSISGSHMTFFGGMWMLACMALKDVINGYREAKARKLTQE